MNTTPGRYRRGETSPMRPGMAFFRYRGKSEQWVPAETLVHRRGACYSQHRAWITSEAGHKRSMEYHREYQKQPRVREVTNARRRRPEIRVRYAQLSREKVRRYHKTEKGKAKNREQRLKHKDKINASRRAYFRERRKNDPQFRIAKICQTAIRSALKKRGLRKRESTSQILGCTFEFFRGWIESQFTEEMGWHNFGSKSGQWEVDHVVPIAAFNLEVEAERNRAFGYENCRPLWADQNRQKGDYIEHNGKTVRASHLRKTNIVPFTQAA